MSSKRNSKKNSIISEVSDEFTNAFTESLSGNRQRKRKMSLLKDGELFKLFFAKKKEKAIEQSQVESSMKNSLGSNKFISGHTFETSRKSTQISRYSCR